MQGWLFILLLALLGLGFGVGSIVVARMIAPRKPSAIKAAPYECGVPPVGDARERQSVKFYLIAMVFLLFDIEVAFLYPWAMAIRDLRWLGYVQVLVFFVVLATGYAYVWKKRALEWDRP
jgi:NADH-quinone oxidoreductase subunit A